MHLHYTVDAHEFDAAGEASSDVKKTLKILGISSDVIRRVSVAMYEAEINMVIHADGGEIDADITENKIIVILKDKGPGIPDINLAMQEGYSTANYEARKLGFGAGMGLPNMKKSADSMEINSVVGEGTTVRLEFNI